MFTYATPTFITEVLCIVTQVQLLLMTVIQHWFTLIGLVSMTCFNSKATPTIDNNYSCHIKAVVGA